MSGLLPWYSPPRLRKRMKPGSSSEALSPNAASWRARTSAPSAAKPMPPTIDGVPRRHSSTTSGPRPSTSKICAPRYPSTVEIPIFDRILSTPSSTRRLQLGLRLRGGDLTELVVVGHRRHRAQRDPRADRVGAVAEEAGDRVRVACITGVDDERHVHSHARRRRARRCTAPSANSDGIGARSGPMPASETTRMDVPRSTAASAAVVSASTPVASPPGPSATANVASSASARNTQRSVSRRKSIAPGYRKNVDSSSSCAAAGSSVRSGRRRPRHVRSDMTRRSRRWSIGGLLTCANRCFRKLNAGRGLVATAANGVSSPIENVGSLASVAMGLSTIATSSRLHPNATCSVMSSSVVGGMSIALPVSICRRPSRAQSP